MGSGNTYKQVLFASTPLAHRDRRLCAPLDSLRSRRHGISIPSGADSSAGQEISAPQRAVEGSADIVGWPKQAAILSTPYIGYPPIF